MYWTTDCIYKGDYTPISYVLGLYITILMGITHKPM